MENEACAAVVAVFSVVVVVAASFFVRHVAGNHKNLLSAVYEIFCFAKVVALEVRSVCCRNLLRNHFDTFVDVAFAVLLGLVIRARVRAGNIHLSCARVIAGTVIMLIDTKV